MFFFSELQEKKICDINFYELYNFDEYILKKLILKGVGMFYKRIFSNYFLRLGIRIENIIEFKLYNIKL